MGGSDVLATLSERDGYVGLRTGVATVDAAAGTWETDLCVGTYSHVNAHPEHPTPRFRNPGVVISVLAGLVLLVGVRRPME